MDVIKTTKCVQTLCINIPSIRDNISITLSVPVNFTSWYNSRAICAHCSPTERDKAARALPSQQVSLSRTCFPFFF